MSTASRPALSPAVLNCWTAYEQTYAIERGKGATDDQAYERGKMAYRQAMPCFSDPASIRDFIACVTHGMVLYFISNEDGAKLLYAANVATGSFRREGKEAKPSNPADAPNTAQAPTVVQAPHDPKETGSDPSALRDAA